MSPLLICITVPPMLQKRLAWALFDLLFLTLVCFAKASQQILGIFVIFFPFHPQNPPGRGSIRGLSGAAMALKPACNDCLWLPRVGGLLLQRRSWESHPGLTVDQVGICCPLFMFSSSKYPSFYLTPPQDQRIVQRPRKCPSNAGPDQAPATGPCPIGRPPLVRPLWGGGFFCFFLLFLKLPLFSLSLSLSLTPNYLYPPLPLTNESTYVASQQSFFRDFFI